MKRRLSNHWRISTAAVSSLLLVLGAYMLARGVEFPSFAHASGNTVLLQAIATKDSDHDGLPDWEETLYGTDPHNPDTFHLGMTDGEAVARGLIVPKAIADIPSVASSSPTSSVGSLSALEPQSGTLTAAFTQHFLALYTAARQANGGTTLSQSQMNDIATQAVQSFEDSITAAPPYKTISDLAVVSSNAVAFKTFATQASAVLAKNASTATSSPLSYLKAAASDGSAEAFAQLVQLAKSYRNSAVGLSVLPVPSELAPADLALINAMMRVGEIADDFTSADADPLATMLALKQYPQAIRNLADAFVGIHTQYAKAGVRIPSGSEGATFLEFADSIAVQTATTSQP